MALPTSTTPIAKSLHTHTVLTQVAAYVLGLGAENIENAMDEAMVILGLAGRPDPYGLRSRALASLTAARAKSATKAA